MYHLCNTQNANLSWLNSVQTILDECGFSYIWETQIIIIFSVPMSFGDENKDIYIYVRQRPILDYPIHVINL